MSITFVFGKAVDDANFIGRERECERLAPKISNSIDGGMNDWSLSLGINVKTHKPEEVYQLPQTIAAKKGIEILICRK